MLTTVARTHAPFSYVSIFYSFLMFSSCPGLPIFAALWLCKTGAESKGRVAPLSYLHAQGYLNFQPVNLETLKLPGTLSSSLPNLCFPTLFHAWFFSSPVYVNTKYVYTLTKYSYRMWMYVWRWHHWLHTCYWIGTNYNYTLQALSNSTMYMVLRRPWLGSQLLYYK